MGIYVGENLIVLDRTVRSDPQAMKSLPSYRNRLGDLLVDRYEIFCNKLNLPSSINSAPERVQERRDYQIALSATFETNFCQERLRYAEELLGEMKSVTNVAPGIAAGDGLLSEVWTKIESSAAVIADSLALESVRQYGGQEITHSGRPVFFLDELISGSHLEEICEKLGEETDTRMIVGVGGGRTMDIMKFVGWKTQKTMIAFPTSLATHVYASPKIHALKPIKDLGYDLTIDGQPPHVAILDTALLEQLNLENRRLIRAGFGDLMAFYSARDDWHLSIARGLASSNVAVDDAINFVIETLERLEVDQPFHEWIVDYFLIQVLLCHVTDWVGSAPASGAEHLFALSIDELTNETLLHGEVVALGVLIITGLRGEDCRPIRKVMDKFQLPYKLSVLDLTENMLIEALLMCEDKGRQKGRYTIFDEITCNRSLFQASVKELLRQGVIES